MFLQFTILLFFTISPIIARESEINRYINKFSPETSTLLDHVVRQYPKFKMEVTLSFGISEERIRFIEAVIEDKFNGNRRAVEEMNAIQETVQGLLGGYWSVQFFESPYMFFSTSFRRSTCFVVFDVNGMGVVVVKEA